MIWHQYGDRLDEMRATAEHLGKGALTIAENVVDAAIATGNLEDIYGAAGGMRPDLQTEVVRAYLAQVALTKLNAAGTGTELAVSRHKVRLTVLREGVQMTRGVTEAGHGIDWRGRYKPITPGTIINGRVYRLLSAPKYGGRIEINDSLLTSYVAGLVEPSDGSPRVNIGLSRRIKI